MACSHHTLCYVMIKLQQSSTTLYRPKLCELMLSVFFFNETLDKIHNKLCEKRGTIGARSKTSKLWLGYQNMLKVARNLIKADRTGSWTLHLQTVSDCLPVFTAAGHCNYLKSAYLYLQSLKELDIIQPAVHQKFMEGLYVVRRTNSIADEYWRSDTW